jgi:hypothetical protein
MPGFSMSGVAVTFDEEAKRSFTFLRCLKNVAGLDQEMRDIDSR